MLSAPDFDQQQIALAFVSRGEKISFKNDNLVITDEDGKIRHQSTCYRLFTLFVVGHASVTTGLLQRAKKFGFSLIFMGHNLAPYGQFNCKTEGNVLLRHKQYTYQGLEIARHLIRNKINQQLATLKNIRNKNEALKTSIAQIEKSKQTLENPQLNLHGILGIEGSAARTYFSQLFSDCNWLGRRPRAKQDPTNLLMDIGYTLLFNFVEGLLNQYGFDLYKGVYHQEFYQRKSLVCDLVEPMRTIIDSRIRKAHHLGQIQADDFQCIRGQYHLSFKKSKSYVAWLLGEILNYKMPIFYFIQRYYRCFMRDKSIALYPIFDKFSED